MLYAKNEKLLYFYWYFAEIITYIIYFFVGLYIIGFVKNNKAIEYLNILDYYSKIVVSLFLMWKFNMFRTKIIFTELDRKIVFQSGLFLFLTSVFNNSIIYYLYK
jgi:hypothetical protein